MTRKSLLRKTSVIAALVVFLISTFAITLNNDKYFEIAKNLEIFSNVYRELNSHYVDELDPNTVMRTAIDAVMDKMDPYTVYYSESQVESYRISTDDKYNGLGANSADINGKATLTEIYRDGPANAAGLMAGDEIVRINGASTEGKKYADVLQFLRGFPGSTVQLTVNRPNTSEKIDVSLTRAEVDMPNVPYYGMLNENIGYITLTTFTQDAAKNIGNALRELKDNNDLKGVVLDLRNNGGGLLGEAIDVLGLFLPKGSQVVSTKGKVIDRDENYLTRRLPIDTEIPLAVMINKSSASASEIVSGGIQDYDRGIIVGQRSYGKGLVQNHKEVGYNSRIKITTSKYYIPSGRCIQSIDYENGEPKDIPDSKREVFYTKNKRPVLDGGGVTPDVKFELTEEPEVLKALKKQHLIFEFVTDYVQRHKADENSEFITFTDYASFTSFLAKKKFDYKSEVEKSIETLNEDIKERGLTNVETVISDLSASIKKDKSDDLDQYKDLIIREIEMDLAGRYNFQEGKTRQNLRTDKEVDEVIALLENPTEYNNLLGVK